MASGTTSALPVFLDTSALTRRYIPGAASLVIDSQVEGAPHVLISEWVLVEWSSGLARECRQDHITYEDLKANEIALMTDIAEDRITVVPTTAATERVRSLLEYVGARRRRALKSGDAVQVVTAMEATTRFGKLRFVSCDRKLAVILREIEPMASIFETLYIKP